MTKREAEILRLAEKLRAATEWERRCIAWRNSTYRARVAAFNAPADAPRLGYTEAFCRHGEAQKVLADAAKARIDALNDLVHFVGSPDAQ